MSITQEACGQQCHTSSVRAAWQQHHTEAAWQQRHRGGVWQHRAGFDRLQLLQACFTTTETSLFTAGTGIHGKAISTGVSLAVISGRV